MTVAKDILLKGCSYEDIGNRYNYKYSFSQYYQNYLDECTIFKDVILDYINLDEALQKKLNIKTGENPFFHPTAIRFFQESMFAGYEMAIERIEEFLHTDNYFDYTIDSACGKYILRVNLTPYGSIHYNDLIEMSKNNTFRDFYNKCLSENECYRYDHPKVIYKVGDEYYIYKVNYYEWQNNYMIKRVKRPHLESVLYEFQADYEQIDSLPPK